MHKAITVSVDGIKTEVEFDKKTSYKMLQDAVGGYFEMLELPRLGVTMWCNEEGKLRGLAPNPIATAMFLAEGYADVICGDVIFTGGSDRHGNTLGLKPFEFGAVMDWEQKILFLY